SVVVGRPLADAWRRDVRPRAAAVGRLVDFVADGAGLRRLLADAQLLAALLIAHALGVDVLDGRVDRLRILARNRHADAAEHARRQPAAELRPGAAPVLRPVERTA